MQKSRQVELANLVIKYGTHNLLDEFRESIWPALRTGRVKGRGETEAYFFHQVSTALIGSEQAPVVFGRLVAKKVLEAEQDFSEEEGILQRSDQKVPAAPSAFFLLTLADHKLSFLREVRRSPSLRDFEYCLKTLLRRDWQIKYSAAREAWKAERGIQRISPKLKPELDEYLAVAAPEPEVRVTPLPSTERVHEHLEAYKVITQLKLKALKTNDEFPDENDQFIQHFAGVQTRTNSSDTKVELGNKAGLSKPAVEKLIDAAGNGNYEAKLKGKDDQGHDLAGDLKSLAVKLDILISEREDPKALATKLLDRMKTAASRGLVKVLGVKEENIETAKALVQSLVERNKI